MPFNFVCIPIFSEKYIKRKVEMNTPPKKSQMQNDVESTS